MVQWLGLCASTAGGLGSVPGGGTKILQGSHFGQKKKKKRDSPLDQTLKKFKEKKKVKMIPGGMGREGTGPAPDTLTPNHE